MNFFFLPDVTERDRALLFLDGTGVSSSFPNIKAPEARRLSVPDSATPVMKKEERNKQTCTHNQSCSISNNNSELLCSAYPSLSDAQGALNLINKYYF